MTQGIPHKHAAVIRAFADGAQIEFNDGAGWKGSTYPGFYSEYDYRVKPEPHKWQEVMDAAKAGAVIQYKNPDATRFYDCTDDPINNLGWYTEPGYEYRVKPEDKLQPFKDAFSEGKRVQALDVGGWVDVKTTFVWNENFSYRIAHKWQHVLDAQARGETVQMKAPHDTEWWDASFKLCCDDKNTLYRIKPKTAKYRVGVSAAGVTYVADDASQANNFSNNLTGFRWLADWVEYEV